MFFAMSVSNSLKVERKCSIAVAAGVNMTYFYILYLQASFLTIFSQFNHGHKSGLPSSLMKSRVTFQIGRTTPMRDYMKVVWEKVQTRGIGGVKYSKLINTS